MLRKRVSFVNQQHHILLHLWRAGIIVALPPACRLAKDVSEAVRRTKTHHDIDTSTTVLLIVTLALLLQRHKSRILQPPRP